MRTFLEETIDDLFDNEQDIHEIKYVELRARLINDSQILEKN